MKTKRMPLRTIFLSANLDLKCTSSITISAIKMTYCGSNTRVNINSAIAMKPVQIYHDGKPSLYNTIRNTL